MQYIDTVDSATALLFLLCISIETDIGHCVYLGLVDVVVFLCECVPGYLLKRLLYVDGLFSARLKVWDVVL